MQNLEVWKEVPDYNGVYKVSNKGEVICSRKIKDRVLSKRIGKVGYYRVTLHNQGKRKTYFIHQLVAIAFLNHKPNGNVLVVNHKDCNKLNNHVDNLEVVTNRENSNKKHLQSSSKYVGVDFHKKSNKFRARIVYKNKLLHLGFYVNEIDASIAYENKLQQINQKNEF